VTLLGVVLGPDGKAAPRVLLVCGGALLAGQEQVLELSSLYGDLGRVVLLPDGRFTLHGCAPDRTYPLFFLSDPGKGELRRSAITNAPYREEGGRLGAVAHVSARQAGGEPVAVRLLPCGAAEFRGVDAPGKGAKQKLWLELLVTPRQGYLAEEKIALAFPFQSGGSLSPFVPDKTGRIRLTGLIPGATYRLKVEDEERTDADGQWLEWGRDFTVESGKTRRLPDLVLPGSR
jgi:hypothetical protein